MSKNRWVMLCITGALGLGALACASKQTPVRVMAEPVEMGALVGEWNGEYSSVQTGRSGSIRFRLKSVVDTAYGDIVMVPRKTTQPAMNTEGPLARGAGTQAPPQVLTIRFVRMEGDRVIGTLDPYTDPDFDCRLTTIFTGSFSGQSTIEGTFESRGTMEHPLTSGKWKVNRVTP